MTALQSWVSASTTCNPLKSTSWMVCLNLAHHKAYANSSEGNKERNRNEKGWNKESNKKTLRTREGMQGRTFKARATKQNKVRMKIRSKITKSCIKFNETTKGVQKACNHLADTIGLWMLERQKGEGIKEKSSKNK